MNPDYLAKLERYCAYQERCHSEVARKARSLGMRGLEIDEALVHLIKTGFLNEERFALLYARSKVNQKYWGPQKIKQELRKKGLSSFLITKAIQSIDSDVLHRNLELITHKYIQLHRLDKKNRLHYQKVYAYLYSKGYDFVMIKQALASPFKKILPNPYHS